jgi:hypothetical protein
MIGRRPNREARHQQADQPTDLLIVQPILGGEVFAVDRQQRQHDAEAEQIDKDREKYDKQRTFSRSVGHHHLSPARQDAASIEHHRAANKYGTELLTASNRAQKDRRS